MHALARRAIRGNHDDEQRSTGDIPSFNRVLVDQVGNPFDGSETRRSETRRPDNSAFSSPDESDDT